METGHRQLGPLTRAVNSGSGNRALLLTRCTVRCTFICLYGNCNDELYSPYMQKEKIIKVSRVRTYAVGLLLFSVKWAKIIISDVKFPKSIM